MSYAPETNDDGYETLVGCYYDKKLEGDNDLAAFYLYEAYKRRVKLCESLYHDNPIIMQSQLIHADEWYDTLKQ